MSDKDEDLQLKQILSDLPPEEDFEEDWNLLGQAPEEEEYQYSGLGDRLVSGIMMGLPTASRRARGIPISPDAGGSIAEGIGEMASFFGPAGIPGRAIEATKVASQVPRIMRSIIGAGEGMATGALQGVAEGDSSISGRILGEGAVGAAIPAAFSAVGAMYGAGMRQLVKPKGSMKYTSSEKLMPDDPVSETGLNTRLTELMEDHGVPVAPMAVNKGRWLGNWIGSKVPQMSPSRPHLEKLEMEIDEGFKQWGSGLAKNIAPDRDPLPHGATGEMVVNDFDDMIRTTYKEPASKIYDEVTDAMSGWGVPTDNLILSLKRHLDDAGAGADPKTGVSDISVGKVRRLISRLEEIQNQDGLIPFQQLWNEAKDLYPTKKSGWTDGDMVQRDAQRIVKGAVRDMASKHPRAGELLTKADLLWSKMEKLEDHPAIAKVLRANNPETLVERMTGSARQLREAKEVLPPEVIQALVQRRFMTVLAESRSDKTDEIVMDSFANKLKNIAGTHGNVEDEWLQEALKDQPEMIGAIREFLQAMRSYDPAREALRPRMEGFGGGSEVMAPGTVLRSLDAMVALITNFATGGQLAKHYTANKANNPFMGGKIPAQDFDSIPQGLLTALRRAGMASGAGEAIGNEISSRLMPAQGRTQPNQ